jgi:hypothetical protein
MKQITIFILMLLSLTIMAQPGKKLKLFVDCNSTDCDFNFIREKIIVADFVRDRRQSDVHILVMAEPAGSGGQKFTVQFIGQGGFEGRRDDLTFYTGANSTENTTREKLVHIIKIGIVPYLAFSGQLDRLNISYTGDSTKETTAPTKDKWNYWAFRIGGNASFSGDKNYKRQSVSGSFSASRVTDRSKLEFFVYKSDSKNSYTILDDDRKSILKTNDQYFHARQKYVKSISGKWSWAVEGSVNKSSYDNIKLETAIEGGIEYNIYPYKLSSSKFFVVRYMLEAERRNYMEETIFNKTKQTVYSQSVSADAAFTQPWGSISSGLGFYNYLHDFSKNNFYVQANVELQLVKGISLNLYGHASIINDQLSLPKQGATAEEVLLRLRALSTSYNYYTSIGISYKFGSKLNNFVNPRFTNGRF